MVEDKTDLFIRRMRLAVRGMIMISFIFLGCMAVILMRPQPVMELAKTRPAVLDKQSSNTGAQPERLFAEYKSMFEERDLFARPAEEVQAQPEKPPAAPPPRKKYRDTLQDFKLVGIILDGTPMAVIENARTQDTLFLKVGDHIDQQLLLEEIQDGKAIFTAGDERIEMKP